MNFEPILYGPLFIRDAQDINLVAASADPVDLTVSVGGSSWTIPVTPVLTNNRYLAALRMREILSSVVGIPGLANAGEREVPLVTLSAGDATMSVRAVYGAASGKTPTQLAGHWLSWRDQVSMTHAWGRERLTFLAGLDLLGWQSGTYSVKAKIFLSTGDPVTVTLASGTLQSGCRYVTVDASYVTIAAAVSASVRGKIRAWDVSYSFSGTDSQRAAATINGYPLRLIIARDEVRVKEFVFCNSFGVEDRVYSSGRSNPKLDGSSVAFLSGASEYELRNDSTEGREVYSGRLGSARESALWLDFLKAHDRYILASGGLAHIIVDSQETDLQDNALGSVKFTYHLGALDNGRYFNDQEGLGDYDPTQRHGALYIGDEPPSEELPSEDLFFLKTRLDEFPVADLSEEYLFLVQDPLTLEWCNAPLSDIKEWLQQVIIHEDVHVWSGPWEQYSAAFADYALAASLGKDLLDRVVALERDLPTGLVQSVAGVGPDEDGDVDADALKGALGLKSAAYREEEYFARASHTHGISDITGLGDDLSTISSALQSLQAQIDSVASRDSFDELTATALFADIVSVGDRLALGDAILEWDAEHKAWHLIGNFYADGFVTAGGYSSGGGGGGGASLAAMWETLTNTSSDHTYDSTKIHTAHIPDMASAYSYVKTADISDMATKAWVTAQGYITDGAITINGTDTALGGSFNTANITAGTAGTSSATTGASFAIPYVTVNKYGIVTSYGTHTHSISQANIFGSSAIGSASLPVYYNGSALAACTASSIFSAMSSSAGTNLSVTVAGQNRTATLYATYDSASENISDKFGIVDSALRSLQAQIDSVASRDSFDELTATALFADIVSVGDRLALGDAILEWDAEHKAWHLIGNFYADGFVTAGGYSSGGGGGGGASLAAMWETLTNTSSDHTYDSTKIHTAHIPDIASAYGYVKTADISDMATKTWVTAQGYITDSAFDNDFATIAAALQSLQSQVDSVAARDSFDELTATAAFVDMLAAGSIIADDAEIGGYSLKAIPNAYLANSAITINGTATALGSSFSTTNITAGTAGTSSATTGASFAIPYVTVNKYGIVTSYGTHTHSISQANIFGSSAIGSASLPVYYNGSALAACTASSIFSAMSSSAGTNLSVTVAGQNRTATLYATYDSASENISDKFGIVDTALRSLQAQIDSVASRFDWGQNADLEADENFIVEAFQNLQAQVDSLAAKLEDHTVAGYFDTLAVSGGIYTGTILSAGYVTGGAGASDVRLKQNVRTMPDCLEVVMALRPVRFEWNARATELCPVYKGADVGFVAQEVEALLPSAIGTIFDDYMRLDQTKIIAPLVGAVQDHELRIREIEKRLNAN